MFTGLTSLDLVNSLVQVEPVNLRALELLTQLRSQPGDTLPTVPTDILSEATSQIVAYTKDCTFTAKKVQALPPITLSLVCPEFGI